MAGPSFPHTLIEFQRRFGTEEACEAFLADLRWPDGFVCPKCGGTKAWAISTRRQCECAACRHQTSTTAGTILHRTKTDLTVWFLAAFLMITDKRGLGPLAAAPDRGKALRDGLDDAPQAAPGDREREPHAAGG